MHFFLPLWVIGTLLFGGGYATAKTGVTPTSIQSIFSTVAPQAPTAPTPAAK